MNKAWQELLDECGEYPITKITFEKCLALHNEQMRELFDELHKLYNAGIINMPSAELLKLEKRWLG